jgi:folate-dependent tRNA-U54 methylase TrmFO/GidA
VVPPVLVQLRRDDVQGVCWGASFQTHLRMNAPNRFSASSD